MKQAKFKAFDNPGGFIELAFIGEQTPESVVAAVKELVRRAERQKAAAGRPVLMLVDVSDVPRADISGQMTKARREGVKAMRSAPYDKVAVYGNPSIQIMANTLALIAGKRDKIRVFGDRVEALRWLKRDT